jgi:hypothetical protein
VKHSLQRRRQTPYQRGLYEHLFTELEDEYPLLWSSAGAAEDVEPRGTINKFKWRLLKRWFAPEKTINKKLYSSLSPEGDDTELGSWARYKRHLLRTWLPQIRADQKKTAADAVGLAELGVPSSSSRISLHSMHSEPVPTIGQLAKASTPLAMADAEPSAVQQISRMGLQPVVRSRRASSGSPRHSGEEGERPGSRGSSGIMIEERNLSDSESDAGEGAAYLGNGVGQGGSR